MVLGRPTEYREQYCSELVDHMNKGYSFESFAGLIGVARSTIYEWVTSQPDFSDAKKAGFEASRLFWEKVGIDIAKTGTGNATAFIFNMKNRFKDEWKDKQETEHSGEMGITWKEEKTYNGEEK